MENEYILVLWPEVQNLMEESWFREEAILAQPLSVEQEWIGSSAYFIPKERINGKD